MELRDKLAFKAFKKADLYYRMSRYRSAIIAFKTLQTEYPDSKYRIEAAYKLFICTVQYADQSVPEKQLERYEEATDYYIRFIEKYPSNEYLREAESVFAYNQQQIKKLGGKATAATISSNPAPKATPEKEIPKDKPAPVEKEKQEETQNEDKPKKQRIKRPERLIDR